MPQSPELFTSTVLPKTVQLTGWHYGKRKPAMTLKICEVRADPEMVSDGH